MNSNPEVLATGTCPNCRTQLHGRFCHQCGQDQQAHNRHFATLVAESFEQVFAPDSKAARTLYALAFKPGFLTLEYFSGRRARYVQPVRLYLTTSILFFFLISISSIGAVATIDQPQDGISLSDQENYEVNIDWSPLTPEEAQHLNERLTEQLTKAARLLREDPGTARDLIIDHAPPVLFCLLPLFALFLKLFYINQGRFYTEHLVLALHNHSFLFLALLVQAGMDEFIPSAWRSWWETPIDIWITLYLFLSLKFTFNEGWLLTSFKFIGLGLAYWLLFGVVGLSTILVGVMTL